MRDGEFATRKERYSFEVRIITTLLYAHHHYASTHLAGTLAGGARDREPKRSGIMRVTDLRIELRTDLASDLRININCVNSCTVTDLVSTLY
jgi:hypothetical protein